MKRPAIIDLLYSVPFMPLGRNTLYYEHALAMVFDKRYWNPWPDVTTVRHEHGTPEQFKGTDDEIMKWPLIVKYSPEIGRKYKEAHPLPL